MAVGSVTKAKKELKQAGLIHIELKENPNGGKPYHEISIMDIWQKNAQYYPNSGDEQANSPDELASSLDEPKKNPLRKAAGEKERASRSSPHYPPPAEETSASDGQDTSTATIDKSSQTYHPAIQAIKQVSGYYPRKKLRGRVANCLGENPNIELLQDCHDLWLSKGHNPMNLVWVFEWYPTRLHYTNPNDQVVLEYPPEYKFSE